MKGKGMPYQLTVAVALACGLCLQASTPQLTIPEIVQKVKPGPYVASRVREIEPVAFDYMVRNADVIVEGTLTKGRSYLSSDQRELFTDYELAPGRPIADRGLLTMRVPGPRTPVIVRQWGGETIIDGVRVKLYDENFPPIPTQVRLLLFLKYDKESGKYEIFDGLAGAFEIGAEDRVRHLLGDLAGMSYHRVSGAPLGDVIAEIHRLGR